MNSSINDSKTKYGTNGRGLYMALLTMSFSNSLL